MKLDLMCPNLNLHCIDIFSLAGLLDEDPAALLAKNKSNV